MCLSLKFQKFKSAEHVLGDARGTLQLSTAKLAAPITVRQRVRTRERLVPRANVVDDDVIGTYKEKNVN